MHAVSTGGKLVEAVNRLDFALAVEYIAASAAVWLPLESGCERSRWLVDAQYVLVGVRRNAVSSKAACSVLRSVASDVAGGSCAAERRGDTRGAVERTDRERRDA